MIPSVTFIFNPLAGPADYSDAIEQVAVTWQNRGWETCVRPTHHAGHAVDIAAQEAKQGRTLVMACGGDGTLGEVANGLAGSDTIMAPLPTGTGNSLAKEWHMPRPTVFNSHSLIQASDSLAKGLVQRMDLGYSSNGRHFLQWVGVGMDSYLVEQIEPRPKAMKRLGALGYMGQALITVPKFAGMVARVEVDGVVHSGPFLMVTVTNCRLYAGGEVLLNPDAVMDDGEFEVWLVHGKGLTRALQALSQIKLGRHQHSAEMLMARGKQVRVETEPVMPYHTDGDPGGMTPFSCEIRAGALRVLVPGTAPRGLFSKAGHGLPVR
jgi:YegS/Rv2252/BmrU family lipid kinase